MYHRDNRRTGTPRWADSAVPYDIECSFEIHAVRLLLDPHAMYWYIEGNLKFSSKAESCIRDNHSVEAGLTAAAMTLLGSRAMIPRKRAKSATLYVRSR